MCTRRQTHAAVCSPAYPSSSLPAPAYSHISRSADPFAPGQLQTWTAGTSCSGCVVVTDLTAPASSYIANPAEPRESLTVYEVEVFLDCHHRLSSEAIRTHDSLSKESVTAVTSLRSTIDQCVRTRVYACIRVCVRAYTRCTHKTSFHACMFAMYARTRVRCTHLSSNISRHTFDSFAVSVAHVSSSTGTCINSFTYYGMPADVSDARNTVSLVV